MPFLRRCIGAGHDGHVEHEVSMGSGDWCDRDAWKVFSWKASLPHVEWMPSEKQLLAYYSLASPRTDTPPTVEILSATDFIYESGPDYCGDIDGGGIDEENGLEINLEYR